MNDVTIGTYSMQTDFGLYLPEYQIPSPPQQTKFVEIIGRDGAVDLSSALGIHYGSRKWTLDFKCFDPTVNWHTLISNVMTAIHGKRLNFSFDDDDDYYWTGRISVDYYKPSKGEGTVRITITSDPFKYKKLSTIVQDTVPKGSTYTGTVVTFTGTATDKVASLSVSMSPSQDLHGYASPWPGGGGTNKINKEDGLVYSSRFMAFGVANYSDSIPDGSLTLPAGNYTFSLSGDNSTNAESMSVFGADGTRIKIVYNNKILSFTNPSEQALKLALTISSGNFSTWDNYDMQLEAGSTPTAWTPYSNICPITGRTGLSVYVSPTQDVADATEYAADWTSAAGTVYGGTLDVVTGVLTSTMANIASYNGETITEPWLSSMDAYVSGATPTTGAQVVYTLATPQTYQITAQQISVLLGTNNVWSDSGNISVEVIAPIVLQNTGSKPVIPTVTASAQMTLMWGLYTYNMQAGTSVIPQLVLEPGNTLVYVAGTGTIKFEYSEASL